MAEQPRRLANLIKCALQYQAAAAYPTAYYGQLARARIGLSQIAVLSPPPLADATRSDLLHAADILYAIGEFDLVLSFVSDFAETSTDIATLRRSANSPRVTTMRRRCWLSVRQRLREVCRRNDTLFPGSAYLPTGRSLPQSIIAVVYSVVRTESAFNQGDISPAKAVGLMQVTPEAGSDTAKRFGVSYDWKRLVSDPVYNTQMGAAEISALFKEYAGSYVMTFAGYNAGRGRVRQWVAQHGDPRDPKVDESTG